MPIGELLSALERSAAAERSELLDGARTSAERIVAAAESDRTTQLTAELEEYRAARQAAVDAELADVERTERRRLLLAKESLLQRLHERLHELLPELVLAADDAVLERLARAALDCAGDTDAELRTAPALAERARRALGATAIRRDDAIATGFGLSLDGGRVIVESTAAALLERWWPRLRIAALTIAEAPDAPQRGGT